MIKMKVECKGSFYGKKHSPESLEKMTGKNHWNYGNGKKEKVICKICGASFMRDWKHRGKYCSRECAFESRRNRIVKECSWCGKPVEKVAYYKDQKYFFCSYSCRGKYYGNKQPSGENAYWYGKRGKETPNWKDGLSYEPYTSEFDNQLKELIRLRDGYKCQKCGMSEIENMEKLTCHHIDYDKKNCKPNNLISLCRNCNGNVNGNRQKWTKYFNRKVKKIMDSSTIQLNFRFKKYPNHNQQSATTIPKGSTLQANGSGSAEYPIKRDNEIVCSYRKL